VVQARMNPAPMHICFCIPAITGGGAERTVANLLTLFHKMGTRLTLLTYEAPAAVPAYPLPDIPVLRLDLLGGSGFERIWKIFTRRRRIRDEIARIDADVVVSFMDTMNVAVTVALRGSAKPVVISERVDPAHHPLPAWKQVMRRIVYPMSQMLIVQTGRVARYFTWIDDDRITVIPNPVHPQENLASPDRPGKDGRFSIVAVGRLARQKGFDDLTSPTGIYPSLAKVRTATPLRN
jgi:GalNAc-alpha-(1->4)-GalNAc-alpha-(1->3)-diNAcBac-PP-undecaprenol alpha-1,4-N-acetyl-D-galactosaminyltransferase